MRHFSAAAATFLLIGGGVVAIAPAYAADATCQGRAITMAATADWERLQGSEDADVIDVGEFDSVHVDGNGGDDVICATSGHGAIIDGGPGNDMLEDRPNTGEIDESEWTVLLGGSAGSDTFLGGLETKLSYQESEAGVAIDLGAGTDTLALGYARRAVVDLGTGRLRVKRGRSALTAVENVRGSRFADVIRGDRRANRFDGKGGDDVLEGRGGQDRLYGGSGRDRAFGGSSRDRCVAERRSSC